MSASSIRSRRSRFIVQICRTSFVLKLFALSLFALPLHPASAAALSAPAAPALASVLVQSSGAADSISVDGVLVAIRQTSIASQIAGTVQALYVKVGDQVKEGQLLLRIDARAATQQSQASLAQVSASRAALSVPARGAPQSSCERLLLSQLAPRRTLSRKLTLT